MADRGYREVITYSFVDPRLQQQLFPDTPSLKLANPISADLADMRVSLWVGLVQACRENLRRQQTRVRLFEMGKKFLARRALNKTVSCERSKRWRELRRARAGRSNGVVRAKRSDFYDVKADVQSVLALTGDAAAVRFEAERFELSAARTAARIYRGATAMGWLGELHPQVVKALNLPTAAFLFELEVDPAFMA